LPGKSGLYAITDRLLSPQFCANIMQHSPQLFDIILQIHWSEEGFEAGHEERTA
jgi:hypothetical protein